MKLPKRPQLLAIAWLNDAGDYRPAVEVLRSADIISPELRCALAKWIENGSKRKRGSRVAANPWSEPPPSIAASEGMPSSPRERRACDLYFILRKLKTNRPDIVARIVEEVGVTQRTAQKWVAAFEGKKRP